MTDLVERLREARTVINGLELGPIDLCVKAADEIERLTAELQATTTAGEALLEHSDEVEADNERLRANIDVMNCNRDHVYPLTLADHTRTIAELRADNERLRAALLKYGDHEGDCMIGQEPYYKCDCGWSKALENKEDG